MKKNLIKFFLFSFIFSSFFAFNTVKVNAGDEWEEIYGIGWVEGEDPEDGIKLGSRDPRAMAAGIINTVLSLLGIIAVAIVLLGGFKWMTAAGNDSKVDEAKKVLGAGVVGLIIVLSAWGISRLVLEELYKQTNVSATFNVLESFFI